MTHCNLEINLLDCESQMLKFLIKNDKETTPVDMFVFSHPYYFLFHGDPVIGHLYKDYEKAFVIFEVISN